MLGIDICVSQQPFTDLNVKDSFCASNLQIIFAVLKLWLLQLEAIQRCLAICRV